MTFNACMESVWWIEPEWITAMGTLLLGAATFAVGIATIIVLLKHKNIFKEHAQAQTDIAAALKLAQQRAIKEERLALQTAIQNVLARTLDIIEINADPPHKNESLMEDIDQAWAGLLAANAEFGVLVGSALYVSKQERSYFKGYWLALDEILEEVTTTKSSVFSPIVTKLPSQSAKSGVEKLVDANLKFKDLSRYAAGLLRIPDVENFYNKSFKEDAMSQRGAIESL